MKLQFPDLSSLFVPRPNIIFEVVKAAIIAEARMVREKQCLSIRALLNCDNEKAEKIVGMCARHDCSPQDVIDLLAMGWSLRQSLKYASQGITARTCHALKIWPKRLTSTSSTADIP